VRCGAAVLQGLVETFSDVPRDTLLAYVGSGNHLEIAVNGGRASDVLGVGAHAAVRIEGKSE
jgi:S-adenosylmethionine hydrolase